MLVLGISGSLRAGSYDTRLLRAAARGLPPEAEFRELNGLDRIPPTIRTWTSGSARSRFASCAGRSGGPTRS
jgi:NAD(P)H-dependent FMN reductase